MFYVILSTSGCSLAVSQHVRMRPGMRLCLTCWLVADFLCLGSVQKLVTREIILLLGLLPNLSHHLKWSTFPLRISAHLFSPQHIKSSTEWLKLSLLEKLNLCYTYASFSLSANYNHHVFTLTSKYSDLLNCHNHHRLLNTDHPEVCLEFCKDRAHKTKSLAFRRGHESFVKQQE